MELSTRRDNYRNKAKPLKKPLVVGFFSLNEKGQYYLSSENVGYLPWGKFSSKKINFDLTAGDDIYVNRTEEHSNGFYRYLCDHPTMVHEFSGNSLKNLGFICKAKVLKKIANMPYQDKNDEVVTAYLYQGNIYLCYIRPEDVFSPKSERFGRWGHKFEQYLLSGKPDEEPDTTGPVIEGEQFHCVFESKLNNHRLLYAAKIDGIFIDKNDDASPVPDIKEHTEKHVINDLRQRKFLDLISSYNRPDDFIFRKFKSRDIYLQNCLSGVETMVIGYRNCNGIVEELGLYNIENINKIGKDSWNSNICIHFMNDFLTFVKKCFLEKISKLSNFDPNDDIKTLAPIELIFEKKIGSNVTLCKNIGDKKRQYLFPWFQEGVNYY